MSWLTFAGVLILGMFIGYVLAIVLIDQAGSDSTVREDDLVHALVRIMVETKSPKAGTCERVHMIAREVLP